MKKSVLISIFLASIMLHLFSACDNQTIYNHAVKPTTSGYEDYKVYGANPDFYLETSNGSYYTDFKYVYYTDRGSTKYVKLCGRPDCKHDSKDCNAYIGETTIGSYNDHIYWWGRDDRGQGLSLYRMNLDGSEHEKVKNIVIADSWNYSCIFHRGYLFYTLGEINGDFNDCGKILYKISLDNESSASELVDSEDIGPISGFTPVNDDIFISVYDNPKHSMYFYSNKTQETIKVFDDFVFTGIIYLGNKALIFREAEGIYELPYSDFKETLVKPIDFPGNFRIYSAGNYIYLVQYANSKTSEEYMMLYIYDMSYDLVDKTVIDIPIVNKRLPSLFAVNSDYLLFSTGEFLFRPDYYIDKSQIGTGKMEFVKIG